HAEGGIRDRNVTGVQTSALPISYIWDGGEVDKTQGTDGPGINLATNQGSTLQITLRETSRSIGFLQSLRTRQENGGAGVTVVMRSEGRRGGRVWMWLAGRGR